MTNILTIDGRNWRTPLTNHPLITVGTARLQKKHYRGVYHYEGVEGYEFYQTKGWLPVIGLQQKHGRHWHTWMVDDPLHWNGMRESVSDLPSGQIYVAGLGLGLMLHHMSVEPRFTDITVVEQNPDVVELIRPTLPDDSRVRIVTDNFYRFIQEHPVPDGILWDLAVGKPHETALEMFKGRVLIELAYDSVPLVQFGIRRKQTEAVHV